MPSAFYCEQGQGPGVVCFHSNCSNSSQWRGLMDSLGAGYRVCALDSYGAGKTMPWDAPRNLTLADEAALADAVLDQMGSDTVVVGHSYGGAVALKTAVMRPDKFKAMVLYEPTLFAVLKQVEAEQTNMDAVVEVTDRAKLAVLSADRDTAARVFIDYWSGAGAWDATPAHYKKGILLSIKDIAKWSHALFKSLASERHRTDHLANAVFIWQRHNACGTSRRARDVRSAATCPMRATVRCRPYGAYDTCGLGQYRN